MSSGLLNRWEKCKFYCISGITYATVTYKKPSKIEKPGIPLSAYADQSYFKLYLSDVGLLGRMSKLPASAWLQESVAFKEFKGAVTENFVLCELVNLQNATPYYWKSGNTAEVDFIIQLDNKIIPIEVKSERNIQAKSLALYQSRFKPEIAIKTSMHPASGNGVKNIPLYNLWNLTTLLPNYFLSSGKVFSRLYL